jgi:hypothetical protein|nr:MAG TPA: Type I restriction enzyme [Caudoviricetes sp.]
MEDKRKTVYEVLKDKTGYKDSFEDFNKIIDNDENARTKVYDVLKNKTGYKDSFDDFNKFLGLGMAATLPVKHDEASQTVLSDSPVETDIPGSDNSYTYRQYDAWAKLTPDARKTLIGNSSFYDEVERRIADDKLLENAGLGTKVHPDSVVSGGVALPIDSRMVAERNFKQEIRGQLNEQIEEGRKEANTQLGEVYDKDFDKKMKFQRDHPFLSSLMDMSSGIKFSRSGIDTSSPRYANEEAKNLNATINKLDDAQDVLEESARKGKTHFFGGLLRGLGKKVFDISTWDAGATDMLDTSALLTASTDKESGKQLSHSQNLLLDAAAVDMAVDENFAGDLGRGYKAGQVTAESVPFMLEFMINPASGLGETVTKSIVKRGIQKYGKDAMKTTIKKIEMGAVRAASDLAGAGIMSATTGSGRVVADTQNRMIGDVRYDYDENGYIHYADRETGESLGTALAKAYGANVIENYSEMLGRYFSPLTDAISGAASRGLEKIGLSKVNRFIGEIKASDWGRAITDFERRTQWNGNLGEYAEEVAGGTLNALFIGDQTLDTDPTTGVFNLDNNIDTLLGVSMMGGFLSGVRTFGYRTPKYKARKSLEKAEREAESVFGNGWEDVKNDIEDADESNITSVLSAIYQSDEYKPEQKEAAIRYASSLKNFQGANLADLRRRTDGDVNEIQLQTENSYDNGYGLNTPEEKNDAKIALEGAIGAIMESHPDMTEEDVISTINSYGNTPSEILMQLNRSEINDSSLQYISQVTDYLNAKAQYDGMIDNVCDGMEGEIETRMAYIAKNTHSDGNVYNATMKVDDRHVYVIGGNIVIGEDGVINHQQSDKSIVIRDAQTGDLEMVDAAYIQSMQPGVNAEQHKTQIAEQIKQDYADKAAAEINGVLPFNPGDTYNILNAETGAREELVVQQVEGDLVTVTGVDGKEVQTTKEEVQALVNRERMLRFKEQYQKETLSRPTGKKILDDGRIISATSANESEVSFDILDQTGNIVDSDVMPRDEYDSLREIEPGTEVELGDDGLPVETNEPLSENPIISEQDIIEENDAIENNTQTQAGLPQDTEAMPVQEEVASETQENAVSVQKGMDEVPVIPVDEKGNLQYHKVPMEMTIEDITSPVEMDGEVYNPTEEEVTGIITANKDEAIKLYEKLNSKPPKIGANKTKYFAEKKQWNEQVADAKKQVDYWNEVEAHVKTLYEKPGDTTANEIKAMGEPMNGEELAAMMLGAGKLPLLYGEYKRETGFGNMDAKKMFGLFASKEKGGMTIEQAGEQLMLADLEAGTNFFDQNDPNAGRNAILDVLSSARTRGGLINYIKNNREAMAERERQAEAEADELAKEQWFQDNYHMTFEEYQLWEQGELFTESNMISDEEYQKFMSIFADRILNEQENDRRTSQESGSSIAESKSNEQEGVSGVREPGSSVLQGEESVSAGTIGRTEEESSQVDANSGTEHDTLQSSPSGRELILSSRNQESVPDTYVPSRMEGESLLDYAGRVNDAHTLHKEEQKVDTNPTDAQKEAGNYKKGHIKIDGFDITIENPRGSERSGVDADGNTWSVTMNNTYGYIRGTEGVDGDHIDVFLGDSGNGVYVVDQVNEDGSFDEHKVMYGFSSIDEAKESYLSNYSPGWKGLGNITGVSKETFKEWIDSSHRKTKPFAEYKSVNLGKVELDEEQLIIAKAKEEGTYMKAPNGEPTNLNQKQWVQTRTKAFKDWFGDWENDAKNASKVVDENGEPLVVYHGTSAGGFTIFNTYGSNFGLFGQGSYFTDNREVSESYTAKGKGNNKQVYGVFLNIRHPLDMNSSDIADGWKDVLPDDIDVEIGKDATNESIYRSVLESFEYNEYPRSEAQEILYDLPVSLGYDGVAHIGGGRYNDKDGTRHRVWIAMESMQIKSATDNNGAFSDEDGDIRFREVKEKDGSKSLVGLHNISGDKLRKALKLGGFANPSAAVIDIDKQSHEGYGEISFVLPSSMVAKNTGRNAGTFSGDAWTPTYPQIERQFTDEGSKRVYDDISKLPKEMQSDVRSAWNGYMEGRDANALAYQFLYEKGEAPELRKIEPVFSEDIRKKIAGVDAIDDYDERNAAILKAYIDEKFDGDRAKFEEYIETRKRVLQKKIDENPTQKGFVYRRAVENLKDIEENGYEYNSVKGFYDEVMSDIRKSGGIDTYQTVRDVQEKISQSAELSKEYNEWKENLADKYGIKEVLFKGYTPSGNRVYLPHTLENVSKMMRQQGLAGATGWGGSFSKFAAGLMKPVGTLNGIRQQKGKLTTNHEEIEAFREKWEKVYFDLGLKLNPDASSFDDTGLYRVEEIATKPNSRSFAKREYGVELSDEDVRQLSDMVAAIRNEYPAMYFETKFERPVYLNEFAAAVVPDNASKDIVDAMNGAGIKVFTYKAGDETSRNEAVENASHINGVRFREDSMKTYHGSGAEFDKFNLSHSGEGEGESMIGKGIYTTRDKRIAEEYAGVAGNREIAGKKHLYEVEIPADNGGNYLDYDKVHDAAEMFEIAGRLHDAGVDVDFSRYFHGGKANGMNLYMAMAWNMPEGMDVNRVLSDAGYVGYKYSTRHDLGGKEKRFPKKSYVVFDESHATITGHEQIVPEIEKISDTLHTPVKIVRNLDELPEGAARKAIEKGRNVKGWFDTKTGEVVIYLPNAKGEEDAKATFLHEIVGHKGLRALFGEKSYDDEMVKIYGQLPVEVRKKVADGAIREYGGDIAIAMDEFLAEQAEKNEIPSWWDKVVSSFRDFLRKMGISLELSDNDVRYLLWRSRKNLERNNPLEIAADVDMRNKLGIGEYRTRAERFRETTDTDEEDMFAEQPDENSVSNPSLLDAYKKRIFELNARISSLERKIDSHITAEELSNEVIEEIKKEIGSDIISEIGKGELSSLLLQVKNAKTKKSLEKIFMNVKRIALSAQSRKLQRMMDKMLSLKVQDVNGKNMSIAKNVDDSTRRIFSFIRGKLSDIKKSGLEDDILYLKRDNRKQQEEIRRLEGTIRDTSDISVKDEALAAIDQSRKIIEENKERIQELRDEKNELEKQIAASSDIDVEKEMSALNEKMDRAAQGETVWTQGDSERMAALNIISGQIMNKSHDFEIQSIELDIQQRHLNNSNLYKDRMKEPSENKRRQINNTINENRRQVVALERLINDTRAMQVKQLQMTIEQLEELISNGKNSLLRRTEEEIKRKCRLIGRAIETVDGKPIDIYDKKSTEEGVLKKFFSAPLGSFEYMCKRVNTKTLGKDGFLYKYFVAGKDGVMKAYDTYVLGMEELRDRLDNKSKEIFGEKYDKVWTLSDKTVNSSGVHIVDTKSKIDGGYGVKYEIPLSKGQAMYIYQVWKMNDGRTKLEMQGFDEESIVEIRDFIGNDYIKFADWIQEELLPELREKYNAKYLEMYGTSLADIKDYVPLRIVKKSTRQESDLSEDKERRKTLEERAGSLIKRVVNTRPVDITMNAFDVLFDHGRQMEEWNAYARVRRDLDAVLSNTTFRNQLDANTRGSFHNFYDAAAVATKTYHPDQNKFMDEVLGKLSKGIVGGNIAWRLSTALKQVLSAPAFWGYSQSPIYMKSLLVNAAKMPVTFKWCMDNIPSFRERVFQGTAGNEKLEERSISKYLDKYIETGMIPNKLVDAVTCSIGAKSIYDYRYGQLVKQGLAEDEARNQALMDADIYYNQTQQSSHPAFLSPMQMSRSIMDRMITTYQNSNIGYVRKVLAAYYDLTRSLKWKELQKNYTDMYVQEGMNEDEASSKAYRKLLNENKKTAFEAVLFAWGMNLLWNIGSKGLLGFFVGDGDDDDNDLAKGISFFLTSPIKGMPGGNLLESIASGYGMNPLLVYDELDKFMKEVKFAVDEYGLISPEIAFSTMERVSRYGGVDLEVLGNIYLGVEGLARDGALSDDKMIDFMYMLNSPKSNRAAVAKELYKDESVASFAEKVARANKYISKHDSWEGWVPGTKDLTRRRKKDIEKEYERFHMTDDEKKSDDEKKIADKHRRKLKELDDDPFALADYIDSHREEHNIYRKYY